MILAAMLVTLGFLLATLLGLLIAPAIWHRAARLTRRRIEATMPMSLGEIEAAQDRVRATYAVRLRRLETALSRSKQKAALQLVDNSRLQMQLAALKETMQQMELQLEERRNAAIVFEQTIRKRFPELDKQIEDLRQEVRARSQDVLDLTNKLKRKEESLDAAKRQSASAEAELARVRDALEKGSGDRSARLLRRPSQWTLEDYRSEYDRLNLELSKMRQQLAQMTDRESHQISLVKSELQRLSELILVASETKPAPAPAVAAAEPPIQLGAPKPPETGARPLPWPRERGMAMPSSRPMPLAERLRNTPDVSPPLTAGPGRSASPVPPAEGSRLTQTAAAPSLNKAAKTPEPPRAPEAAAPVAARRAAGKATPDAVTPQIGERAGAGTETEAPAKVRKTPPAEPLTPDAPPAADVAPPPQTSGEDGRTGGSPLLNGSGRKPAAEHSGAHEPLAEAASTPPEPAQKREPVAPVEAAAVSAMPVPAPPLQEPPSQDKSEGEAEPESTPSEPLAKPLSDARELRALSELLTMNAGGPAAKPAQADVSREARQGFVIEGEAAEAEDASAEPRPRKSKRSLLDRLRNTPEPAEAEK